MSAVQVIAASRVSCPSRLESDAGFYHPPDRPHLPTDKIAVMLLMMGISTVLISSGRWIIELRPRPIVPVPLSPSHCLPRRNPHLGRFQKNLARLSRDIAVGL